MRFWVIHAQEHLGRPKSDRNRRMWRSNTIAEMLADRGHEVIRWRSAYSHHEKRYFVKKSVLVPFENFNYQYIFGRAYRYNVGAGRILHHQQLAGEFNKVARGYSNSPDLIHVSNVPIELCLSAVRFGNEKKVPVVVDIRDLWPDLFLDLIPDSCKLLRPVFKLLLSSAYQQARESMRLATAITGITDPFVDWGLRMAGRERKTIDQIFHMSYPAKPVMTESDDSRIVTKLIGEYENKCLICYFGNIGYQSDFNTLIQAAKIVGTRCDSKLVICGDGPKLGEVRRMAKGIENVVIPGWVDAAGLMALMRVSTFGVIPFFPKANYLYNMPNKFAEYLSGGLVIACGLEGEMANKIKKHSCGFVYQSGDPISLAEGLLKIIHDKDLEMELSRNARQLFYSEFDSQRVYKSLCDYLELVAATRPNKPSTP